MILTLCVRVTRMFLWNTYFRPTTELPPQLLTFDDRGVSLHPNHISLALGAAKLLSLSGMTEHGLKTFVLRTRGVVMKYTGIFSAVGERLAHTFCQLSNLGAGHPFLVTPREFTCKEQRGRVIVSTMSGYYTAIRAMLEHRSQLIWFRWLYVSFSRYMWVNDWIEIRVVLP